MPDRQDLPGRRPHLAALAEAVFSEADFRACQAALDPSGYLPRCPSRDDRLDSPGEVRQRTPRQLRRHRAGW